MLESFGRQVAVALIGLTVLGQQASAAGRDFSDLYHTPPTVFDAVNAASVIARVKLVKRNVVRSREETGGVCGYLYQARVIELVKGQVDRKDVSFFSNVDSDYAGMAADYLVFVSANQNLAAPPQNLADGISDPTLLRCAAEYSAAYVPRAYLGMYPFDQPAAKELGGEWLAPSTRSGIAWCWNGLSGNALQRNDLSILKEGGKERSVESWLAVKRQIEFAMKYPASKFASCTP